ncbi:hypothetical protein BGZ60DRAFT_416930 [Tricladium varicosporioides]|nr:hypothetical protein BGZ60DRAFT_416930 [Hymenoscyphus varicosporioides]
MYITSLLRFASIALLALLANNVYGRSGAKLVTRDPRDSRDFVYWGCFSVNDIPHAYAVLAGDLDWMTREVCASKCESYVYSWMGIFRSACYCGAVFPYAPEPGLNVACDFPCPGDAHQFCGGFHPNATRGSNWWSIYNKVGATTTTSSIYTSSSSMPSNSTAVTSPTIGTSGMWDATLSTTSTATVVTVTSCDESVPSCTVGQVTTKTKSNNTTIPPETKTKTTPITSQTTNSITSTQVVTNGTSKTSATRTVTAPTNTPIQGNAVLLQAGANSKELGLLVFMVGLLLL